MFREMRRCKQALSEAESIEILKRGTSGVLAVAGDEGYPYAVPLSYVYWDHKIYFHTAKAGHKIDAIRNCDKVSFCVIDQDQVVPEKFTTCFRSAIAFGRARIIEEDGEKRQTLMKLARRYCPDETEEALNQEMDSSLNNMFMVEITIEHLSGKEAIELVKERNK